MTTQFANASYQEIIDLHTEDSKVSVVGIHTPCTATPIHMLRGFFDAFQKFHYNGCSLALVPAARLPADPLQVSYDAGEAIDPRDILNPILWHGCHGNDMGAILNSLYSGDDVSGALQEVQREFADSAELNNFKVESGRLGFQSLLEALYYRALTDNTWQKAHPQRGFRKGGLRPLVYDISTNMQFGPQARINAESDLYSPVNPADGQNGEGSIGFEGGLNGQSTEHGISGLPAPGLPYFNSNVNGLLTPFNHTGQAFFTHRLKGLGWMETRQVPAVLGTGALPSTYPGNNADETVENHFAKLAELEKYVTVPRLFMGMILLPPAYKVEQYYRLVINHSFSFKKFRGVSMRPNSDTVGGTVYGFGDIPNVKNFN